MKDKKPISFIALKIFSGIIIVSIILTSGCVDLGDKAKDVIGVKIYGYTNVYPSSTINANFEGNNQTFRNVSTLASQYYSVEDVLPTEGIPPEDAGILLSQFENNSTIYLVKVLVPHDKKMFDDEYPEYLTFFIHQNSTDMAWSAIPWSTRNYPQDFVADIVKLSFNVSDREGDQYAEIFGEKISTVSIPHQPEVRAIVDYLNESGDPSIKPLGNGNYLIEFFNDSLPYGYKTAGSIFVHTEYLKITHTTESARYEIMIDRSGNLNTNIKTWLDGVSLEEGKVVLKGMFEDIGLDTELIDEFEFEVYVV
ncbi:hypothetical protein [Methanococcoides burtonii]|uniref:Uncharacterized protein n=1 Tax=Methanococcoides burtonii (strain DSM 6242 / NBRC 107633 / OCM 468 / ACE-M) TaxID=259564 RepID=Q12Y39_METBU|nr:hypothetical protein [Methanococcoides burtonii]ABE51637.1 Hypothetical protein Mbur_0668 [Methanococcoides burtonii DSM 6242]